MKLEQTTLPVRNKLLSDYWSGSKMLQPFYEYHYSNQSFEKRATYLKTKKYNTKELSNIIRSFMEPFGISKKAEENLIALQNGGFAVVGGQQAGILTGPLYSVHKVISVIHLAKIQSEKLNKKIVPIFWIAGEDHDIDEINHTYTIVNGKPKKKIYSCKHIRKLMASVTDFDKYEMQQFIREIFQDFGETEHTSELYQSILKHIDQSTTFTEFFARLMNALFQQEGLLLIDAAYPPFRKFQSPFFKKIIHHNEEISKSIVEKESLFIERGYGSPLEAKNENANLFYVNDGERCLLERKNEHFINNQANVKFTKKDLLNIAETAPEQLSNNVATRPLMQEMTIPVLAFVAGPGELAYWGLLKDAFHILDLQMPILAPRINITFITRNVHRLLEKYHLSFEDVVFGKTEKIKNEFIEEIQDRKAKDILNEMNRILVEKYNELSEHLTSNNIHLNPIIEKNKQYHERQFRYLADKIEQTVLSKHETILRQMNQIDAILYPNQNYQERTYNPYQFINEYGNQFIDDLMKLPLEISKQHNIVYL